MTTRPPVAPFAQKTSFEFPHDLDAEQALLGAILVDNNLLAEVQLVVSPRDMYRAAHGLILEQMLVLQRAGTPIDYVTLKDALVRVNRLDAIGGPAFLASLGDGIPRQLNVSEYARIVRDAADPRAVASNGHGRAGRSVTESRKLWRSSDPLCHTYRRPLTRLHG